MDGRIYFNGPTLDLDTSIIAFSTDGAPLRASKRRDETVGVRVYDASGRLVRTLVKAEHQAPGVKTLVWDGRNDGGRPVASARTSPEWMSVGNRWSDAPCCCGSSGRGPRRGSSSREPTHAKTEPGPLGPGSLRPSALDRCSYR